MQTVRKTQNPPQADPQTQVAQEVEPVLVAEVEVADLALARAEAHLLVEAAAVVISY